MGADVTAPKHLRRSSLLRNIGGFWKRNQDQRDVEPFPQPAVDVQSATDVFARTRRSSLPEAYSRGRAVASLPRPLTDRRQESEQREKLLEVPPSPTDRRTLSVDRRRGNSATACRRTLSPPNHAPLQFSSAPDISGPEQVNPTNGEDGQTGESDRPHQRRNAPELPPLTIPSFDDFGVDYFYDDEDDEPDTALQDEYDQRWILNLSMHFRDKSNREKFFVTYAEKPSKWRRLTVSLDYRDAPEGSLEAELSALHYQRDKSFQIYQSIRESLADIQFFPTVTNLKLETNREDGQLHVHVREDANEIVQFPSTDLFSHIRVRKHRESDLEFVSHLSGFVYKVRANGKTVIKKEIPGPDNIDEFLYEVNALDALLGSPRVVDLEGLVTDESGSVVKGLLISFASQGALVDMLYDFRGSLELPWYRREKWAKQIVQGLSDIHEAGFVQGDFTLSNIVIDENDNAVIIDINRRGCPVGWEPPELGRLIDSGQRIGMCIGVKTDGFQLGMVLWALAEINDEPEREPAPLRSVSDSIPSYFRDLVASSLSERPQRRPSAKKLLQKFPACAGRAPSISNRSVDFADDAIKLSDHSVSTHRSDKEYIDPDMAVTLDDVNARSRRRERDQRSGGREVPPFTTEQVTYFDPSTHHPDSVPASTSYRFESSGSWVVGRRGRSPFSCRRRRSSPFARSASTNSSATSLSRSPPSRSRRRCGSEMSDVERGYEVEGRGRAIYGPTVHDIGTQCDSELAALQAKENGLVPQPLEHKRVTAIMDEVVAREAPLLHTDSGFDEEMVREIEIKPEAVSRLEKEASQTASVPLDACNDLPTSSPPDHDHRLFPPCVIQDAINAGPLPKSAVEQISTETSPHLIAAMTEQTSPATLSLAAKPASDADPELAPTPASLPYKHTDLDETTSKHNSNVTIQPIELDTAAAHKRI